MSALKRPITYYYLLVFHKDMGAQSLKTRFICDCRSSWSQSVTHIADIFHSKNIKLFVVRTLDYQLALQVSSPQNLQESHFKFKNPPFHSNTYLMKTIFNTQINSTLIKNRSMQI